jgi:peptide/nickel transport system permease protein
VLVVFVAASLAFILLQVAPGDPFSALFNAPGMTPELRAQLQARYGFDEPVAVQYLRWLTAIASGEFGWSPAHQRPVVDVLRDVLPNTLLLMSLAYVSSIVFGVVVGMWQALRAGSRADRMVSTTTFVMYSMPEFWLAMLLLLVFAGWLRVLPPSGTVSDMHAYMAQGEQLLDRLRHLVLPWLSLTLVGAAVFARFQRAAMRDVLTEPFMRNAHARGLPHRVVRRHALRASLTPVVTIAGLFLPAIVAGAVFVETIFAWNGMGWALLRGIHSRDYALVSAIVVIGSALTVIGSLLADIVRELLDPRVRAS